MPNTVCPHCGASGRVPDTFLGRRVRCPKCQQPFTVTAPSAPAGVKPKAPPAAAPGGTTLPVTPRLVPQRPLPPPPPQEDALEEVADEDMVAGGSAVPVELGDAAEDAGAPDVRRPKGQFFDFGRAFAYTFEKKDWFSNVLMIAVNYLILFVGWLAGVGYMYDLLEHLCREGDRDYPSFEFGRYGRYLGRALPPFVVGAMVAVPLWLVFFVLNIGLFFLMPDLMFRLGNVFTALRSLVWLVVMFFLMPACFRAGLSQSYDVVGHFKFVADLLKRVPVQAILVYLILVIGRMVLYSVGMMLCCIGACAAAAFLVMLQAGLYYQLYRVYLDQGGPPIPFAEEAAPEEEIETAE